MDFFVENYKIFLEVFGYIGTALVIISMMMTSVVKLRIINMCGGLISLIYAVLCNTWPVVVLNACLISINMYHTVKYFIDKKKNKNGEESGSTRTPE